MRLRADIGEVDVVLADWWQEFSQASDAVREDLVAQLRDEQHKGQRRVRSPKPAEPAAERQDEGRAPRTHEERSAETGEGGPAGAPRKRRRRRRKPSGEGGAGPAAEPGGAD